MAVAGFVWRKTEAPPGHVTLQITPARMGLGGNGFALRGTFSGARSARDHDRGVASNGLGADSP